MKKSLSIMQYIISITVLCSPIYSTPLDERDPQSESELPEEKGHSITTALTVAWKLANTSQEIEKRDLIAKAIDDFKELMSSYKTLITQQPRLEHKVAHTITVLQQRLANAEKKLRLAQTQEADLTTAQAEVQKKAVELDDLRKELRTLQEENNRLRNQVTLMFHEHGITDAHA
jgi:predicted  nucleic acid-binding Zn-ribbon protein